jgi:glycosyltransferase involved in cell wall biosynthesis
VVEAIARLDMRATDVFERDDTCQGRVVTLLHVGSIVPRKAVLLLVDALRILTDRGRSVGLQLVGGGDPSYEAAVRAAVRAHGLDERVEFAGLVTHVPSLLARYRQADIFVMASLGEGFPRVLIEAAAQGLPVVATSIETVAGTMRHEHDALLVPPGSGEALANGVERLMGDGRLRSALIRNGHAFARAHFARGRPSAQLWQLIRDSYPNPAGSAP